MTKETKQSMGGRARAESLSASERKDIASRAALARWKPGTPRATHKGELRIGGAVIPCYVLEDGRRLLSQRGTVSSLGMSWGTSRAREGRGERLAGFIDGKGMSPFISDNLRVAITHPVEFSAPSVGLAHGFEASLLTDLCDAVLAARRAGALQKQQQHIADQCETLVRGLARVGIIALVDEATGYQEVRDRYALQAILDKYLLKELAAWAKKFPDEFYQQLFRLRGWQWKGMKVGKPQCIGVYTNDLVYERLAPGILDELQQKNPKNENGNRTSKHHQWLTEDVGNPALAQHLHAVVGLMRASHQWGDFKRLVDRAFPKKGHTLLLPMELDTGH